VRRKLDSRAALVDLDEGVEADRLLVAPCRRELRECAYLQLAIDHDRNPLNVSLEVEQVRDLVNREWEAVQDLRIARKTFKQR
jgi:hypothetical protein